MPRWMCGVTKLDKIRNERIRGTAKVGRYRKESRGKEVEVVWSCDEKSTRRRWLENLKEGPSADEVYDRATWRRMSSYIDSK